MLTIIIMTNDDNEHYFMLFAHYLFTMTHIVTFISLFILHGLYFAYSIPLNQKDFNHSDVGLGTSQINASPSEGFSEVSKSTGSTPNSSSGSLSPREENVDPKSLQDSHNKQNLKAQNGAHVPISPGVQNSETPHETFCNEEAEENFQDSGSTFEYVPVSTVLSPDWARSPYQGSPSSNLEALGIGMGNYRGILYPHEHPRLFAALNPGFTVNSLPPVHSTYIHGLYSPEDIGVLNPENTVFLPTHRRILRQSDDDFLAQLSHDAIMNNILPTMPVPFVRYAGPSVPQLYGSYGVPSYGPAVALFPNAAGGRAQPLLFSCTPMITRGSLKQNSENAELSSPAAHVGYRHQTEQTDDNMKVVANVNKPDAKTLLE